MRPPVALALLIGLPLLVVLLDAFLLGGHLVVLLVALLWLGLGLVFGAALIDEK